MSHKEVKSEEQSELNITRRSVLGAGAVIAGAGIVGSQIIDPLAKTAYAAGSDAIRSKSDSKPIVLELELFMADGMNVLQTQPQSTSTVLEELPGDRLKLLLKMTVLTQNVVQML